MDICPNAASTLPREALSKKFKGSFIKKKPRVTLKAERSTNLFKSVPFKNQQKH